MVGGLVEHYHVGVLEECAHQCDALALPSGQMVGRSSCIGQLELRQQALAFQLVFHRWLGVLHGGFLDGARCPEIRRLLQEPHFRAEAPRYVSAVGAFAVAYYA